MIRSRKAGARAIVALLVSLGVSCSEGRDPPPERVLVIVLDTTHAAHLGCYGGPPGVSPHVDALAARGRRFAAARSNSTWTLPSTVSLLSGRLQESHGVVTNHHRLPDDLAVLPELASAAGWRSAAFVEMLYASAVHGLDRGFDDYHYYSMTAGAHPGTLTRDLLAWIDARRDERWLLYVHLRRPHSPYEGNPAVQRQLAPDCALEDGRLDGLLSRADSLVDEPLPDEQLEHLEHLYRGNLANADRTVGQMLDHLGADPHLLVLLTSDHGEALGRRGRFGHGYSLDGECVDIPLIVAGPGVVPGTDGGSASTVDVLPTLLDALDLEEPPGLDGRSLWPRLSSPPVGTDDDERPLLLSTRYLRGRVPAQGVISGRFKLVLEEDGLARLFDLAADPGELDDLGSRHPDVLARLLDLAEARRRAGQGLAERDTVEIDVREEELRALGYLR